MGGGTRPACGLAAAGTEPGPAWDRAVAGVAVARVSGKNSPGSPGPSSGTREAELGPENLLCLWQLFMIPHKAAVTSHKGGPRLGEGRFVMGSRLCVLSQIYMTLLQPPERKFLTSLCPLGLFRAI